MGIKIALNNAIKTVVPEFVATRVLPNAPTVVNWVVGGLTALVNSRADDLAKQYLPVLQSVGLADSQGLLDVDTVKKFLDGAFAKQPELVMYNFKFNQDDSYALVALLNKYGSNNG